MRVTLMNGNEYGAAPMMLLPVQFGAEQMLTGWPFIPGNCRGLVLGMPVLTVVPDMQLVLGPRANENRRAA